MKYIARILLLAIFLLLLLPLVKQCTSREFKPNNELIETQKDSIKNYKSYVDSLELELLSINLEILEYQNKLQVSETKFKEFKKTPKYIEKIKYIKENISIDTLASNTIELEHCIETNQYKDSTIVALENSVNLLEIQKDKQKIIIQVQERMESQLLENIMHEYKETEKAKRNALYWKIATGTLGGLLFYDKIIK